MEAAKALGGSFKLVMLAPKTVREITQLPKETRKNGYTNKSKGTNEHAKHKPRLNMHTKKTLGPTGLYELVLCTWKTSDVQPKCQGPLQLLSPPFLMTNIMKQMGPNGKGGPAARNDEGSASD